MKDLDLGVEYVIPSLGYRNVREQSNQEEKKEPEDFIYQKSKPQHLDCQDALETAARAEGLPLDLSLHSNLRILDEGKLKGKYHNGLNLLKPIRLTSKHQHPVDNAGLFSFMTFSWLTPLARSAYKKGELFLEDIWPLSKHESSDVNSRRLEKLWQDEVVERGADESSLRGVVWKFCRTRLIISIMCLMLTQLAGFIGPNFQGGSSSGRLSQASWAETLALQDQGKVIFIPRECLYPQEAYACGNINQQRESHLTLNNPVFSIYYLLSIFYIYLLFI
ncbi:ATP-binding cassette sub-family C member 5 isoform 4-T4 [Rhinophrynus dorsalis]